MIEQDEIPFSLKRDIINRYVPFPAILPRGKYDYYGSVFCPFHDNVHTPSAKLYKSQGEGDTLFCFAEHKVYRPFDLLYQGLSPYTIDFVFDKIYPYVKDNLNQIQHSSYTPLSKEPWYNDFKEGRLSFDEYISRVICR